MSTHDKDTLQEDLDTLAQQYASETGEEPPELLDRAVLNAARRAVEGKATRPWNFGWMHATASLALVVLGLAIVLELRNPAEVEIPADTPAAVMRDPSSDADVVEAEPQDAMEAYRQSEALQMEAQQQAQKSELMRELREEALSPAVPRAPTESPLVIIRPAPPLQQQAVLDAAPTAEVDREEDAMTAKRGLDAPRGSATPGDPGSAAAESELGGDLLVFSTAEEWLDYIVGLWQLGEEQAWRSELEAFRQAFPQHPLPQELLEAAGGEPDGDG